MFRLNSSGNAASSYQEQAILNESPIALIARLYEMAVLEIARARAGIEAGNRSAKCHAVRKAAQCLSVLQCSLNMDEGGEIAANLDRIYGYLLRRLNEAHLSNDDAIFAEIGARLTDLGSAWREIAGREGVPAPAAQAAESRNIAAAAP